jgi:broad specificity phosphatase PhoE
MTDQGSAPSTDSNSSAHTARPLTSGQLWVVRHGETEWSRSGQHTGRTDLPLTQTGEEQARDLGKLLKGKTFRVVLTSPLLRARETCRLAGYGDSAVVDSNLREWNYGDYEGRTTGEIQKQRPGWSLWKDGVPGGECIENVAARARAVIDRVTDGTGDALIFAHGHILRILTCCWLGLPPQDGRLFALGTATLTTLGYEHGTRVITRLGFRLIQ